MKKEREKGGVGGRKRYHKSPGIIINKKKKKINDCWSHNKHKQTHEHNGVEM